jgi:manganese/zinc/iron transport system permease protein
MLLGAGAVGVLTVFLTDVLNRHGRLQTDASIGVTFTWLFALGVILINRYAAHVDLDLDCVLYGEIIFAPFDTWRLNGVDLGPRSAWVLGGVTLANLAFVILFYRQLKICTFDPALAASLGIKVLVWHYALMSCVSVTAVSAFESVGAILVVAMLIAPANAAYLLTDRLSVMLVLACGIGVLSAAGGYALATWLDGAVAGAMAVVAGGCFALAALFSPSHGVLVTAWRRTRRPPEPVRAMDHAETG